MDHFDGHQPLNWVMLLSKIYLTHPATANASQQFEGTDPYSFK